MSNFAINVRRYILCWVTSTVYRCMMQHMQKQRRFFASSVHIICRKNKPTWYAYLVRYSRRPTSRWWVSYFAFVHAFLLLAFRGSKRAMSMYALLLLLVLCFIKNISGAVCCEFDRLRSPHLALQAVSYVGCARCTLACSS